MEAVYLSKRASSRRKQEEFYKRDLLIRRYNEEHKIQRPRKGPAVARSDYRCKMMQLLWETACEFFKKLKYSVTI